MKIIRSTDIQDGVPNPGEIWTYKTSTPDSRDHRVFMRITDAAGSAIFFRCSEEGDMYSLEFTSGEVYKTKQNEAMVIYKHAELRL